MDMENYVEICGQVDNRFSWKRLLNVARWDLAVNRTFYLKVAALIGCTVMIPVLYYYIMLVFGQVTNLFNVAARWQQGVPDLIGGTAFWVHSLGSQASMLLMGYMFHNLLTRQGRINELTLPATNAERFLWHVLRTVVGPFLVFWLSVCVVDALHVLLGWTVLGQTEFSSLTMAVIRSYPELWVEHFSPNDFRMISLALLCSILSSAVTNTFYALGNAWKYKNNIAFTLVVMVAVGTVMLVFAIIGVSYLMSMMDGGFLRTFFEERMNYFIEYNQWMEADTLLCTLFGVISLLEILFLALLWWVTYRLYCRAQITTKRNP